MSSDDGSIDDIEYQVPKDNDNNDHIEMEQLQKALAEAERIAQEANEKAATLRKIAEDKKHTMDPSAAMMGKGGNGTKIKRELLVERLV